jgi:hypothetical protein
MHKEKECIKRKSEQKGRSKQRPYKDLLDFRLQCRAGRDVRWWKSWDKNAAWTDCFSISGDKSGNRAVE